MPRYPRAWILEDERAFHKVWRGHNKEWNLSTPTDKLTYLRFLGEEHVKQGCHNPLHALALMSNHAHEIYSLENLKVFSNFMRQHHGRYGAFFNRSRHRKGKVAQDRPFTCSMEDDHDEMIVTFYIHANPLRANIVKDAKDYLWSTHNLYAFGKKSSWMKGMKVTFPPWYMALGATPKLRQRRYRQLFDAYLKKYGLRKQDFSVYGVGSLPWCLARKIEIRAQWRESQAAKSLGPPG